MKRNLIVCTTPLHVVIAELIIDLHPNEEFWGMVYTPYKEITDKYSYYISRLEAKCQRKVDIIYPKYKGNSLQALWEVLKDVYRGYTLPHFDCLIKADYRAEDALYITHRLQNVELKSFDDGMMNLAIATYHNDENVKNGRLYRAITRLFGIATDSDSFRKRLTEHFTIYKQRNVIEAPKMTYVSLFPKQTKGIVAYTSKVVSIFLGQPIYELEWGCDYKNVDVTQYLIERYVIQYYFPHPRENYQIKGVEYINSPLIIEDYLLQELAKQESVIYKIYSYCSSALLNLQGLSDNVQFTALYPTDCPDKLKETYGLIRACGVSIVEVDTSQI